MSLSGIRSKKFKDEIGYFAASVFLFKYQKVGFTSESASKQVILSTKLVSKIVQFVVREKFEVEHGDKLK